jgi:hypothetical protein
MKNRHETPATTPQFGYNSLIHSQMRTIMPGRGACFVSICVYFCLLLPPLTYESHLARLFHRDLHELQRPQAERNLQLVSAQLVMDIDLNGAPTPPTDHPSHAATENAFLQNELPPA